MKKKLIIVIVFLFGFTLIKAQNGDQAVTQLLQKYEKAMNLSEGYQFSNSNIKELQSLFVSSNALVPALGLGNNDNKQISLDSFIALVKSNFDPESDVVVKLSRIKKKSPETISSNKYTYLVSALQSVTGFKKDGSGYSSNQMVEFTIDYTVSSNLAKFASVEVMDSKKGLYLDVHALGAMTNINGELASGISGDLTSSGKFSFGFGLNLDYMFTENIGVGTGFTMMSYSSSFTLSSFNQEPFRTTDIDGDEYDLLAVGNDISNDVKLNYIEIPISVVMRFGGFMTRLGVKYGLAGSSTSDFTDGTISTSGYYPKYSVTLEDIPEYGFDTYSMSGSTGEVLHESSLMGFVQLGYYAAISQKVGLSFLGFYQTSFGAVSSGGNASLTTGNNQYTSVLNLMDSPKVNAFGLEVGLSIKLF